MRNLDRNILQLALPSIVSNITVPLLGLCDVTIMGHVGGASGIGAIAVGSMIFNVMYWLFVFLRMGVSGLTAQAYGACRWHETHRLLRRYLSMALLLGMAIVVLQVPLRWLTFWLMQTSGEVEQLCTPYYHICIWGAPAVLGLYALTGWLVGMQNTRIPMIIAIGQNVVNIAASLVLVFVFHLGLYGVALGTLTAQWAGFLTGLAFCGKQKAIHKTSRTHELKTSRTQNLTNSKPQNLNIHLFLRTLCLVSVNLFFTSTGSAHGPLILAANTLLMQFFMIYSYLMDGFANAGEALAGRYQGAGQYRMLSHTVRRLFLWGGGVALLFTICYSVGGTSLLKLLTNDTAVVATAQTFLPWAMLIPMAGLGAFVWDGIFIGTTMSRGMLLSCFCSAVVFFGLWAVLAPVMQNHALWLAFLTFLLTRGGVQTVVFRTSSTDIKTTRLTSRHQDIKTSRQQDMRNEK